MILQDTEIRLKDGRTAILRSAREDEADEMRRFVIQACGETDYLMRRPEEYADFSVEQERDWLRTRNRDQNVLMIACFVGGRLAGNSQISFGAGIKDGHRASVAIALLREFWGLGIGTRMFEEIFRAARERGGIRQIELDFIEGNTRARSLYEKMGFRITGVRPDAIRLKDGRFLNEYMMVKKL